MHEQGFSMILIGRIVVGVIIYLQLPFFTLKTRSSILIGRIVVGVIIYFFVVFFLSRSWCDYY